MNQEVANKIEQFFSQYKLRNYAKGQVLILSGDDTHYVYQLVEGKVKMYDVTYRGDEIVLNMFKPPAFFPMSLAINNVLNPYIYEADTNISIRQVAAGEVVEFIKANPDVMYDLLSRLYRGTDGLIGRIAQLMAGSAQSRLIYELVLEARRFGTHDGKKGCTLSISEKDLGTHAGLSRETVSREINKLKVDGYITVKRQGIHINDLTALENKLGQIV